MGWARRNSCKHGHLLSNKREASDSTSNRASEQLWLVRHSFVTREESIYVISCGMSYRKLDHIQVIYRRYDPYLKDHRGSSSHFQVCRKPRCLVKLCSSPLQCLFQSRQERVRTRIRYCIVRLAFRKITLRTHTM